MFFFVYLKCAVSSFFIPKAKKNYSIYKYHENVLRFSKLIKHQIDFYSSGMAHNTPISRSLNLKLMHKIQIKNTFYNFSSSVDDAN